MNHQHQYDSGEGGGGGTTLERALNHELNRETIDLLLCLMICIGCLPLFVMINQVCLKPCLDSCKLYLKNKKIKGRKFKLSAELLLDECPICLDNYQINRVVMNLDCNHVFHHDCIKLWLQNNNTCPQCRENII
jgi:hypothetical protein